MSFFPGTGADDEVTAFMGSRSRGGVGGRLHSVGSSTMGSFTSDTTTSSSMTTTSMEKGLSFDELIDRLVAHPVSKQESRFACIFLCLYRKFAAPATLLEALKARFERNESSPSGDALATAADQLQLLNVTAQWAAEYPGDFAHGKTRKLLRDFVTMLERSPYYMFAAKEISSYVEGCVEDDAGWPYRDDDDDDDDDDTLFNNNDSPAAFLSGTLMQRPSLSEQQQQQQQQRNGVNEEALHERNQNKNNDDNDDNNNDGQRTTSKQPPSLPPSSKTRDSYSGNNSILAQSLTSLSIEAAQRGVRDLDLPQKYPLSKVLWHQFMEIPDEDFARELTRIDWIMYNSFGPRDLVRHVTMSPHERERAARGLKNVSRMVHQFNRLAFFVSSMILLRDKPKHRVRTLEKFMSIAQVSCPSSSFSSSSSF